jgi:cytochrome c oxidase subunit 1
MMFLFAVPIMQAVGLYFVPLMIGTRDIAFPRMNALGYYTYLFAGILLWGSLFIGTGPDTGWFSYVPLAESRFTPEHGVNIYSVVVTLTELSALIAVVELIITIARFRAPGMTLRGSNTSYFKHGSGFKVTIDTTKQHDEEYKRV